MPGRQRTCSLISLSCFERRYAIDPSKLERELGWAPETPFEAGIDATVRWYIANDWWWRPILSGAYAGERLGVNV